MKYEEGFQKINPNAPGMVFMSKCHILPGEIVSILRNDDFIQKFKKISSCSVFEEKTTLKEIETYFKFFQVETRKYDGEIYKLGENDVEPSIDAKLYQLLDIETDSRDGLPILIFGRNNFFLPFNADISYGLLIKLTKEIKSFLYITVSKELDKSVIVSLRYTDEQGKEKFIFRRT